MNFIAAYFANRNVRKLWLPYIDTMVECHLRDGHAAYLRQLMLGINARAGAVMDHLRDRIADAIVEWHQIQDKPYHEMATRVLAWYMDNLLFLPVADLLARRIHRSLPRYN